MVWFYCYYCTTIHFNNLFLPRLRKSCCIRQGVRRLDGARGKKQVCRPHVKTWGLSEGNALYSRRLPTCVIVGTFQRPSQSFGAHIVIWRPGIVPHCPLSWSPWYPALQWPGSREFGPRVKKFDHPWFKPIQTSIASGLKPVSIWREMCQATSKSSCRSRVDLDW